MLLSVRGRHANHHCVFFTKSFFLNLAIISDNGSHREHEENGFTKIKNVVYVCNRIQSHNIFMEFMLMEETGDAPNKQAEFHCSVWHFANIREDFVPIAADHYRGIKAFRPHLVVCPVFWVVCLPSYWYIQIQWWMHAAHLLRKIWEKDLQVSR